MLIINEHLSIADTELQETFIRSAGPGGQNVNKVATAVQLRFDLGANSSLRADQKVRLRKLAGHRLTKDDVIVIKSDSHRTQSANRDAARRRLAQLIREALPVPVRRIATRPTKGSVKRRLDNKRKQGLKKADRKTIQTDD
ncbi:MAG: aminoacyl-tRNA hydrolase [Parvularculaceae bacterium]|nr:aminoacyl-tRNA hydrolase [Parvularculaceae bacterium]